MASHLLMLVLTLCSVAQLPSVEEAEAARPKFKGPMITIEAKFIEIAADSPETRVAVPWLSTMVIRPAVPTLQGVLAKEQAWDLLQALNAVKGVDVLSTPRVTSHSGQQAVIEIGREFRYPTKWKKDEKTGGWEPAVFESKNTGVTFGVLADRKEHDVLELMLQPEVVEFLGFRDLDAADGKVTGAPDPKKPFTERTPPEDLAQVVPAGHRAQPIFSTRQMDTQVVVWPGQSVLLELGASDVVRDTKRRLFVLVTANVAKPEPEQAAVAEGAPPAVTSDSARIDQDTGKTILAQNVEGQPKSTAPAPAKTAAMERAEKIILPMIEIRDAKVRDAVSYLATKSRELDPDGKGVNVALKLSATDTTTISLSLENVPLSEALKYLAELAGLKLETGADGFLLRDATAITPLPEPALGSPEAALLNRARGIMLPRVEFNQAKVDEGVDFLRKKSAELDLEKKSVNIVVQHSEGSREVRVSLSLVNVSVAEALRYLSSLAGLQLEIGPSAFVLRPAADQE